jgi:hypothetical protein
VAGTPRQRVAPLDLLPMFTRTKTVVVRTATDLARTTTPAQAPGLDFLRSLAYLAHTTPWSLDQLAACAGELWVVEEERGLSPTSEGDMLGLLTRATEAVGPITSQSVAELRMACHAYHMVVMAKRGP